MAYQTLPLGNKPYSSPYNSIGKEVCQNLYVETSQSENAKAQYYFLKIPGMKLLPSTPTENVGACRAIFTTAGQKTYVVNSQFFYELYEDGTKGLKGTLNSYTGVVNIAENGYQMIIVDGLAGYIFDYSTQTFVQITDEYFPGNSENTLAPTHVTYIDTYFIVNSPATNQYLWSNTYYQRNHDNTTTDYDPNESQGYWNALQMGQKMGRPDFISSLVDCTNMLWLFGSNSIEVHYDTGDYNNQLFARYEGAIIEVGCSAPYSVSRYANNVFWLGADKSGTVGVFTNNGMQAQRISTRGIEQIIEFMPKSTDCVSFTYAQAGHVFYIMQFPTSNKTLVYDLVTQTWHERTYLDINDGTINMWNGMFCSFNWSKNLIGHSSYSSYFELSTTYYQNDNPDGNGVNYIRCIKTSPIEFNVGLLNRFNSIQVMFKQGTGLSNNTPEFVGKDPEVQIAWSNDGGESFINERTAKIGQQGNFQHRARLTTLGLSRNRVWRITITDPVEILLVGLIVDVTPMMR